MTQDIKDVLKLAFEALDNLLYWDNGKPEYDEAREAITAIKEALREHALKEVQRLGQEIEQEPVAWMRQDGQRVTTASDRHNYPDYETRYSIPLYTIPPQEQQSCDKRTWVGLTDEDVNGFVGQYWGDEYMKMRSMVRAIEAKLKERNT
jgi:hypothetical protein